MYLEDFVVTNAEETDDPHVFRMPDGTYTISCDEDGRTTVEFEPPMTIQ